VTIQDKPNFEQINLINQLDEEDRTVVFKIIDTMLTKKNLKDFFQQNTAALYTTKSGSTEPGFVVYLHIYIADKGSSQRDGFSYISLVTTNLPSFITISLNSW